MAAPIAIRHAKNGYHPCTSATFRFRFRLRKRSYACGLGSLETIVKLQATAMPCCRGYTLSRELKITSVANPGACIYMLRPSVASMFSLRTGATPKARVPFSCAVLFCRRSDMMWHACELLKRPVTSTLPCHFGSRFEKLHFLHTRRAIQSWTERREVPRVSAVHLPRHYTYVLTTLRLRQLDQARPTVAILGFHMVCWTWLRR